MGPDTPRAIPWCMRTSNVPKGSPGDRRPRPRQLDDGMLADANKAEAAPIESWTLGMSS